MLCLRAPLPALSAFRPRRNHDGRAHGGRTHGGLTQSRETHGRRTHGRETHGRRTHGGGPTAIGPTVADPRLAPGYGAFSSGRLATVNRSCQGALLVTTHLLCSVVDAFEHLSERPLAYPLLFGEYQLGVDLLQQRETPGQLRSVRSHHIMTVRQVMSRQLPSVSDRSCHVKS